MKAFVEFGERGFFWLLLSFSAIFSFVGLTLPGKFLVLLLALIFWILRDSRRINSLYGFLIALLPGVASGSLLIVSLFYLLFSRNLSIKAVRWLYPFLFILVYWGVIPFCSTEYTAWRELIYSSAATEALSAMIQHSPLPLVGKIEIVVRYLILALLFLAFGQEKNREDLLNGLFYGVAIATLLIGIQVFGDPIGLAPEVSPYWLGLGRFSGTFTDPNAFGISALLIVTLFLVGKSQPNSRLFISIMIAFALLAIYSGSRSYFLGVALLMLGAIWRRNAAIAIGMVTLGLCAAIVLRYYSQLDPSATAQLREQLPGSIGRMMDLVTGAGEGGFSRKVFWTVGTDIWLKHPLLGVGLGSFQEHLPGAARRLGFDLGGWVDNSNNFYLGLLAELGIVGLLGLLLTISALRFKANATLAAKYSLGVFLCMLLFGPHIDFFEVTVLFALLLAVSCEVRDRIPKINTFGFPLFLIPLFFGAQPATSGLYAWELQPDRSYLRWSMPRAKFFLDCSGELTRSAVIRIRALNPDISTNPLKVIFTTAAESQSREITDSAPTEVRIQCLGEFEQVTIDVSRSWIPREFSMGDDSRVLGIQLLSDSASF